MFSPVRNIPWLLSEVRQLCLISFYLMCEVFIAYYVACDIPFIACITCDITIAFVASITCNKCNVACNKKFWDTVHSVIPVPAPWRSNHGHRICSTVPFQSQGKYPLAGQVVDVEYWCSVSIVKWCNIACNIALVACVICDIAIVTSIPCNIAFVASIAYMRV